MIQGGPKLFIQQYNSGAFNYGILHRTGWT